MKKYLIFTGLIILILIQFCSTTIAASIALAWDQNYEDDLAGYRVHWGTQSSDYKWSKDVGKVTKYEIAELHSGTRYYLAVTAIDYWGNESVFSTEAQGVAGGTFPESYQLALDASVPNPFSAEEGAGGIKITYSVPERLQMKLEITNALGQKIRTLFQGVKNAGLYEIFWDGTDSNGIVLSSGVYFCSLVLPNSQISKPITVLH